MRQWLNRFGPGYLVTAAFIGPGTVTTATIAGARFGFALLWALVFSVAAAIVLQEMSARLGLVTRQGLGEALRTTFSSPSRRCAAIVLVVAAIAFGNAAFQTGNITGAAIGLEALTGVGRPAWALVVGAAAFALLAAGVYLAIERLLILLVGLMAVVFVATMVQARPAPAEMMGALIRPALPPGALVTVIALIGTTVVPYNLFLHASSVREKWDESVPLKAALRQARLDTIISIMLGGVITFAVIATASAFFVRGTEIDGVATMARQLEPLLGRAARSFFAVGLLAAGLTSAVTAPLAAAYATAGALGWSGGLRSWRFRAVWAAIIVIGTVLAILGRKPVAAIVLAQAANGILLPVVAVFLLIVLNRSDLLGRHRNGPVANVLSAAVVLVAAGLGLFQLLRVSGLV